MLRLNDHPREPGSIAQSMTLWRLGVGTLPQDYVTYHREIAEVELERLRMRYDFEVLKTRMVTDDWPGGFRALEAVIETRGGRLMKLVWHDGNRAFMKKYENSGGAGALFEGDLD